MKLPLLEGEVPAPSAELVEGALRKFLREGLRLSVLYTAGNRQTIRFTGIVDAEAGALKAAGLARVVPVEPDHRFRVVLTDKGNERRDQLARRLKMPPSQCGRGLGSPT